MRENSYTIQRVNDLPEPVAPPACVGAQHVRLTPDARRCACGMFSYRRTRAYPPQGNRETLRRLKQIARRQLSGSHISAEARATCERARLAYHAAQASQACHDYINEAIELGEEDRLPGRDRLYVAVDSLARWLRGEPEYPTATATISVTLGASAEGDRGEDLPGE